MAASGSELEGALGRLLPLDITEVGIARRRCKSCRPRWRLKLRPLEMVNEREQVGRGQDIAAACPDGFGTIGRWADQATLPRVRADGGRQHTGHRDQRAVEAEFAERDVGREVVRRQHLHRHEEPEGDREVEVAALLLHVRRRQVHGNSLRRQGQAQAGKRAAHALPALGHRLVREAHDHECREARTDMHLHIDRQRLDTLEGDGLDMSNHAATPMGPAGARPRPGVHSR